MRKITTYNETIINKSEKRGNTHGHNKFYLEKFPSLHYRMNVNES